MSVLQNGSEYQSGVLYQNGSLGQSQHNQPDPFKDRRTSDTTVPQHSMPNQVMSMNAQIPVTTVQQQMAVTSGRAIDTVGRVSQRHMSTNVQAPDAGSRQCRMTNQDMATVSNNIEQQGYLTNPQLPGYPYPSQQKIKTEAQAFEDSVSWSMGQPPGQVSVPMETEDRNAVMQSWTRNPTQLCNNYVTVMDENVEQLHLDDRTQGQGQIQGWHDNSSL